MKAMQTPSVDHAQFDAICAQVGDFEPLPAVVAAATEADQEPDIPEDVEELDSLILAGLVLPV